MSGRGREDKAVHRTRCAISETIAALKTMGVYEVARDASGRLSPVKLDPAQRRGLLVYLSELEELVKILDGFKQDLAQNIEQAVRGSQAASLYQRTGLSLKKKAHRRAN